MEKVAWSGRISAVQPRIRLMRSVDERSHSYLGYVLGVDGEICNEEREFLVGIGKGAQAKREFRVGDVVLIMPWVGMSKPRPGKKPKAHIIWRYTRTQTVWLQNHRYLKQKFVDEIQNI